MHTHMCAHAHTRACAHAFTHARAHAFTHARAHAFTHAFTHADAQDNKGRTPVWLAAKSGNAAAIELLVKLGADISIVDNKHRTPGFVAFEQGHVHVAGLLREYGHCGNIGCCDVGSLSASASNKQTRTEGLVENGSHYMNDAVANEEDAEFNKDGVCVQVGINGAEFENQGLCAPNSRAGCCFNVGGFAM